MAKILVIEDDKISSALVQFGLKSEDFDVVIAHDGRMGLKQLESEKIDLIVLDIMMPNMNGYEFMAEAKKMTDGRMPPVFILTANEKLEDIFRMEGVKGYFVKPVDIGQLIKEVKTCLSIS